MSVVMVGAAWKDTQGAVTSLGGFDPHKVRLEVLTGNQPAYLEPEPVSSPAAYLQSRHARKQLTGTEKGP